MHSSLGCLPNFLRPSDRNTCRATLKCISTGSKAQHPATSWTFHHVFAALDQRLADERRTEEARPEPAALPCRYHREGGSR
jgi:hypothetical protein